MSSSSFATFFAQVTNAAANAVSTPDATPQGPPAWTNLIFFGLSLAMI
jgi:hypothetical protein